MRGVGVDLWRAENEHRTWPIRLSRFIAGHSHEPLDSRSMGQEGLCEFGAWLAGEGQRAFGGLAVFQDLIDAHRRFHEAAGEVVRLVEAGDKVGAKVLLDREVNRSNEVLLGAIRRFRDAERPKNTM